eukprot:gene15570-21667_t
MRGCIAPLACGIAHSAIELGLLDEHLDCLVKPQLAASCAALCQAVRTHLVKPGDLASDRLLCEPHGGYFVDCSKKLLAYCTEHGFDVAFTPGSVCGGGPQSIRLCFAFYTPEELEEGVKRLALAVESYPEELEEGVKGLALAVESYPAWHYQRRFIQPGTIFGRFILSGASCRELSSLALALGELSSLALALGELSSLALAVESYPAWH